MNGLSLVSVSCRLARSTSALYQPARLYWWGHETEEDIQKKKLLAKERDVVTWSEPASDLQEKKEFVWSPSRVTREAELVVREQLKPTFKSGQQTVAYFSKFSLKPWDVLFKPERYMEHMRQDTYAAIVRSQFFVLDRLLALGPDLSAAHFLCYNNCRVRFRGHTHWTELNEKGVLEGVPTTYVKGWYIEAIDACTASLVYEGLQNLRNLHYLKYLDISYCNYIDEWCMDRISGEYSDTLEYLNISGCRNLNWNGLEILWRFKKLKTLVIKDMDHVEDLTLVCLLLLDIMPNLKIVGAEYMDTKLLEGSQYQDLLEDDFIPKLEGYVGPEVEANSNQSNAEKIETEKTERGTA